MAPGGYAYYDHNTRTYRTSNSESKPTVEKRTRIKDSMWSRCTPEIIKRLLY